MASQQSSNNPFNVKRLFTLAAALLVPGYLLGAGSILSAPADQPCPVDLLIVLGGGHGDRITRGYELIQKGYATKVLLTGVWNQQPINQFTAADERISYLEKRGITRQSIYLDASAESTFEEASLILSFMNQHQLKRALIVTDPPHLLRLKGVINKTTGTSDLQLRLIPTHPAWWNASTWWANPVSAAFVLKETTKLLYYTACQRF